YTYGRSKIAWKNFFSNSFNTGFSVRNCENFESGIKHIQSYDNETTQNGLINSVVEGQHALKHDKLQVNWNLGYGYSYRNQPDQRILALVKDDAATMPDGDTTFHIRIPVENSPAIQNAGRVFTRLYENIYGGGLNLTLPFRLGKEDQQLKFGGLVSHRDRHFSAIALGYATNGLYGELIHLDDKTTPGNIFSNESLDQRHLFLAQIDLNSKDYQGLATLGAGYVMLDNKFGEKVRLAWGARLESYSQELKSRNQPKNQHHNTDILPSANLTYLLSEKSNLRASYFQSVNRPEFRELADFRFYDYENEYNVIGNPTLKRARIANADLRFEHFSGAGEIISASVFYKKFKDPIEQLNEGNNVLSYSNASEARDYGAEVEVRKRLDFTGSRVLERVVLYANAALINSKVTLQHVEKKTPLQGQSPYLVNGGLSYASPENDLTLNLLYNRIGQRLRFRGTAGGLDTYEKPRDLLDFQVTKKVFHKKGEVKLNISDLLSQPVAWYYKFGNGNSGTAYKPGEDRIVNSFKPGTTFALAFRYSF
ncbi:MAG TPA: TonB-dependent receptor, partial [Chitinophaga sp.]